MRPSVVFIAGASRSGSTLLELMLGSMRGVVALGEVHNAWQRGAHENQLCGCGLAFLDCPVWADVMARLHQEGLNTQVLRRLQSGVVRNRRVADLVMLRWGMGSRESRRYALALETVFRSCAQILDADVLVDSSKRPAHGLVLAGLDNVDLTVVHLVRDSRAMAFSALKNVRKTDSGREDVSMRRLTAWESARGWNRANVMSSAFRSLTDRYVLVRYEDLVDNPKRELDRICVVAGIEADFGWLQGGRAELAVAHTVSGNPLRTRRDVVTLRLDDVWRNELSQSRYRLVTSATFPLLMRYGYSLKR